jgi:UDP-3-O-[3-hydroxymyristoyl] glucosamine N-acyltransferase
VISLNDLAAMLGGRLAGPDGEAGVRGVSTLQDAASDEVCYYGNPVYRQYLSSTRALAVIASEEVPTSARNVIVVGSSYDAFRIALEAFAPDRSSGFAGIHPSAVVHESARLSPGVAVGPCAVVDRNVSIGAGTVVGALCYIGPGTSIGGDCLLHPRVVLEAETSVGDRVTIHSGAVLGSDGFGFVPDPSGHRKVPQNGNVVVEDDVEIGANCCIDRATTGSTVIRKFTKLDNLIQIAHNVVVGPGSLLAAQVGISGSTHLGRGVVSGGQAGLAGHIEVGDGAVIGAQAGVTKSVPAGTTVSGYPARPHSRALLVEAALSILPEFIREVRAKLGGSAGKEEEPEK